MVQDRKGEKEKEAAKGKLKDDGKEELNPSINRVWREVSKGRK